MDEYMILVVVYVIYHSHAMAQPERSKDYFITTLVRKPGDFSMRFYLKTFQLWLDSFRRLMTLMGICAILIFTMD